MCTITFNIPDLLSVWVTAAKSNQACAGSPARNAKAPKTSLKHLTASNSQAKFSFRHQMQCCGKLYFPFVGRSCSTCDPLCVCVLSCMTDETCVGWESSVCVVECF